MKYLPMCRDNVNLISALVPTKRDACETQRARGVGADAIAFYSNYVSLFHRFCL